MIPSRCSPRSPDIEVGEVHYGPVDEWVSENREAEPVLARKVNKLKVGETLRDGGGAAPLYLIARLA